MKSNLVFGYSIIVCTESDGDFDLFQKAVLCREPWEEETSVVPIPWGQIAPKK